MEYMKALGCVYSVDFIYIIWENLEVQSIIAQGITSKNLYDLSDGDRGKLFLFVRVSACIRGALQTIMGSHSEPMEAQNSR